MMKKFVEKLNCDVNEVGACKIVCLGDSVTQGCFESNKNMHGTYDYQSVYHNLLKNKINDVFPKMPVQMINAGIGGKSAKNAVKRLERDVLSYSPDLVIVCFGLNDVNGDVLEFQESLSEIFERVHPIETIFMTPNMLNTKLDPRLEPSLYDYAKLTMEYQNSGKMDLFMKTAVKTAEEYKVTVCHCYRKWKQLAAAGVDTTALLANYVNHPRRNMHELFAACLFDTIFFE